MKGAGRGLVVLRLGVSAFTKEVHQLNKAFRDHGACPALKELDLNVTMLTRFGKVDDTCLKELQTVVRGRGAVVRIELGEDAACTPQKRSR